MNRNDDIVAGNCEAAWWLLDEVAVSAAVAEADGGRLERHLTSGLVRKFLTAMALNRYGVRTASGRQWQVSNLLSRTAKQAF